MSAADANGTVLVTWPGYREDDPEQGALLGSAGLAIRLAPKVGRRTPGELVPLVSDVVGAIVSTDPFDAAVFAAAPRLRVVARVGIGTDSIDLDAATRAGVAVTTTPGALEETVADHTLALMLASLRRVVENDASVRRGEWERAGRLTGIDLNGATVGLIGLGTIGRAVARRLLGFGSHVIACDPAVPAYDGVELVDLPTLLRRADVVSIHLPLTTETRGLIGADQLKEMRRGAVLVNTARGGIVDESALAEALENGHLRAAALDVFAEEPPPASALLRLENAVFSPHIAGISERSLRTLVGQATRAVIDVLAGRAAPVVNPDALARPRGGRR